MSNFLNIGSVSNVPVAQGGATLDYIEVGDRARAFDGSYRASITTRKRRWSVKTGYLLQADAATLKAALLATPSISISGDWPGGTITVWPVLGQDTPMETVPFTIQMSFTLEEA